MSNGNAGSTLGAALYFRALTPLHPGSGANPGVIDLPIQRERHTRWPNIPASALKGVFRDFCRQRVANGGKTKDADSSDDIVCVFGRSLNGNGDEKGGTLSFTDARILALPVRSMFGVYALVTCPAVLQRLGRDLALAGLHSSPGTALTVGQSEALVAADSVLKNKENAIVLEEYPFRSASNGAEVVAALAALLGADDDTRKRLAILSDDEFTYFAENATEVQMRIALDYDTKTVSSGALFSQEFLPAETLLYSLVLSSASRGQNGAGATAMALFRKWFGAEEGTVLQIGGDETTGKGFCRVHLRENKGEGQK